MKSYGCLRQVMSDCRSPGKRGQRSSHGAAVHHCKRAQRSYFRRIGGAWGSVFFHYTPWGGVCKGERAEKPRPGFDPDRGIFVEVGFGQPSLSAMSLSTILVMVFVMTFDDFWTLEAMSRVLLGP